MKESEALGALILTGFFLLILAAVFVEALR